MKNQAHIIRAEVIGSLLRPKFLLDAQDQLKKGQISPAQLVVIEDKAIKTAVATQKKAGVDVVTDGEMRRPVFCHNFVKAVDGFEWGIPGNSVIWFTMQGEKVVDPVTVGVVRKIKQKHDVSVDEFAFLRGLTDMPIKITLPSPTMMSYYFAPGISEKVYPSPMKFLEAVTTILKTSVRELERQGVKYIQIDAPEFGMLLDPVQQKWFRSKGFEPESLIRDGVKMINEMLEGFSGTTGLHICRGNDKNRFMARGGYGKIAKEVFQNAKVDRLLLEFDSDRSGDFSPLVHVPKNKMVVLGLISTKSSKLEVPKDILERIDEAAQFVPKEQLAISTQCGFASVAKGNNLSLADQEKKLRLVSKIARKVW